jgi:hypothetical protein
MLGKAGTYSRALRFDASARFKKALQKVARRAAGFVRGIIY